MARNYTNTASQAATTAFVDATATAIALTGYTGFPAAPFTAALARGTAEEEVVLVTSVSGSTVTVTRGYDSTNSVSHSASTTFQHVVVAKDYADSATHQAATSGVHGLTGGLVGTTDTQTLTNKTLTAPAISAPTFTGAATGVSLSLSGALSAGAVTATTATLSGLLTTNGGITVPTGKVITITDAPAAGTDGANKTYADARETAAKAYTDTRETATKTYADGLDTARKTYVDARTTAAGTSRNQHWHFGDVTAFPSANMKAGDTCRRTDIANSVWQYDGTRWVGGPVAVTPPVTWANFSLSGSTGPGNFDRLHYTLDLGGNVTLRGLMRPTNNLSSGIDQILVGAGWLPVEIRPPEQIMRTITPVSGNVLTGGAIRFDLLPDGSAKYSSPSGIAAGTAVIFDVTYSLANL